VCVIISGLFKRLFNSLVLLSFLWMTLFQTIAFAEFERARPEFAVLEHDGGTLNAVRFNVGVERLEAATLGKGSDSSGTSRYADILRQTTDLFIPTGQSFKETQSTLDLHYKGSSYERIKFVENGLTWTSEGYNFYFHESGHLHVSRNSKVADANRNMRFFNAHGAVFLSDDMDFDSLALDAKDVVQTGTVRTKKLITKIAGRYSLEGHLAVSELIFDENHSLDGAPSPMPTFVNTQKGTFEGVNLTIRGNAVFQNDGIFDGSGTTTFALDGAITNNGRMQLSHVMVEHGILFNTGTFRSEVIEGSFKTLANKGTVSAQNFRDVSVETFINYESGTIGGNGHILLSGKDPLTERDKPATNQGRIESNSLSLTLNGDFTNEGTLSSAVKFETDGAGTFYQKGTLSAKAVLLDNRHIVHSGTFNRRDANITLGQNVASFTTTKKSTLTAGNLVNHSALLVNAGTINLTSWDQRGKQVQNQSGAELTVAGRTTLTSDLIQNKGKLTFKGMLGGHVDTFTNQGTLNTHDTTELTGDKFLNHSVMRSHAAFTFNGSSFTSSETANVEASQPMSITTISPLDLKGMLILKKSGSFTAPTIANHAFIRSESGKTTFNGVLENHHYLDVDELAYEQKTLINNGKLFANRVTSTTLMDHITNTGTFMSRAGGFKTRKTINKGILSLDSGKYDLGVLENKVGSTFQTERGMSATVTDIINDGTIISKTSLILDSLKGMTKLGVVKAVADLILKSTYVPKEVDWMDEFLWTNKHNLHVGRKLIIETERFVNRMQFTRAWDLPLSDVNPYDSIPYYMEFHVTDFVNYGTLTTRGLTIRSKTFKNGYMETKDGKSIHHLKTIHVYGPMDIEIEGDVDNRFGDISVGALAGTETSRIKSLSGKIINGYFREVDEITLISYNETDHGDYKNQFGYSLSNHPFTERHKIRNGAKIVTRGKLILEALDDIDNEFGLIYGFYANPQANVSEPKSDEIIELSTRPEMGVTLKTPKTVLNKSGHILSGSHIQINAKVLNNRIGDEKKDNPNNSRPGCWGGTQGAWRMNVLNRVWHESDSAHIESLNGNIYLDICQGDNTGGYLISPEGIVLNDRKYKVSDGLPSFFTNRAAETYNEFACKDNSAFYSRYNVEPHGAFKSGKNIVIDFRGIFTLSGSINSLNVTLNADVLEVIRPHLTICPKTGNFILNGASIFRELTQSNSLFIDHNGTHQAKLLGLEDHSVPRPMPSINRSVPAVPRFSKIAMQHLCSYLFGTYLGTLNVYGRSGYPLIEHLYKQGEPFVNQVISLKNTSMSHYAMANILEHCAQNAQHGCIFNDEQGSPHFLITQDMILDIARQYATITASNLKIDIKDKSKLDGSVFAAYNPYDPRTEKTEDTSRPAFERPNDSGVESKSETQEEHQPLKATSDINLGYVDAVAAKFLSEGTSHIGITGGSFMAKIHEHRTANGTQQTSEGCEFQSKDAFVLESENDVYCQAIHGRSDTSMLFKSKGNIFDIPAILRGAHTTFEQTKRGHKTTTTHTSTAETSTYTCKGAVVFDAAGHIDVYATRVRAAVLQFMAGTGVTIHDVHNSVSTMTEEFKEGKGWFGKDTTLKVMHQVMRSIGADFGDTPTEIILRQRGLVDITNITVDNLTIDPKGGTIRFNLGKNFESLSQTKKNESAFWQTQSMSQESHQTGTQSNIKNLKVISTAEAPVEINIEQVRGQTAKFIKQIELDHGHVTETFWDEVHEHVHKRSGGPTAATAALIAIAVAATTYGTGIGASVGGSMATSMGFAAEGMAATMFTAGFTSVATSAVMSLANNEGDPRKAAEAFASRDTFQSLGMSMLSAGLTYGMLKFFELPTDVTKLVEISDHAANQGVNMGVRMTMDTAFTGKTDGVAAGLGAVAGTIGGYLSTKIGQWYAKTPQSFEASLSHKIQHFVNGAGQGMIMGLNDKDGEGLGKMIAGAAGALAAETYADWAMPTGGSALPGSTGSGLNQTDHAAKIRQTQAAARFMAGATAYALGMNAEQIGVAMVTANIALDHNFAPSAALRHIGLKTDTKGEIVNEDTLQKEATEKGISKEEQDTVRAKLNALSRMSLGDGKTLSDNITTMPTSIDEIDSTKKTLIKGYVQKIASVNQNIHQILNEHPWAQETLTSSMNLFGDCVRTMLYIDMSIVSASGVTGLCAAGGVKSAAGLRACAVIGGLTGAAVTALSMEQMGTAISEGVSILGDGAAEIYGDTPAEKAAIRQLIGDTVNVAGLIAGASYLKYRAANSLNYGGGVTSGVVDAEVGGVQAKKLPAEIPSNVHNLEKLNVQLTAEQIVKGHAFDKHLLSQGEFGGISIRTHAQLQSHVEMVLTNPATETYVLGITEKGPRIRYVHRESHTVIVHNPAAPDRGTVFQPSMDMDSYLKQVGH